MRHLLSRGWDEMATNKIDGVAHCARCLCLPAFIRQPFCCPLPEMSTTILYAASSYSQHVVVSVLLLSLNIGAIYTRNLPK